MVDTEEIIYRALVHKSKESLCPAEAWNIISGCLEGKDVPKTLDALSPKIRQMLISEFNQSYYASYLEFFPSETKFAIYDWCQKVK